MIIQSMPEIELSLNRFLLFSSVEAIIIAFMDGELIKPVNYEKFVSTVSGFNGEKSMKLRPLLLDNVDSIFFCPSLDCPGQ